MPRLPAVFFLVRGGVNHLDLAEAEGQAFCGWACISSRHTVGADQGFFQLILNVFFHFVCTGFYHMDHGLLTFGADESVLNRPEEAPSIILLTVTSLILGASLPRLDMYGLHGDAATDSKLYGVQSNHVFVTLCGDITPIRHIPDKSP